MTANWAIEEVPPVGKESMLHTAAASHGATWAFGISVQDAGSFGTLVFHRGEQGWRQVAAPGIGRVNRAAAISDVDVWAVGDGQSMHWDGVRWQQVPTADLSDIDSQLFGLAQIGEAGVWTAGYAVKRDGSRGRGTVQRWDGGVWTALPMPDVAADWGLAGISGLSDGDAWAVGHTMGGPAQGIALHWDGKGWGQVPVPIPESGTVGLQDVLALASNDVLASGYRTPPGGGIRTREPIVVHWDGAVWSVDVLPGGPGQVSQLVKGNVSLWGIGYGPGGTAYVVRSSGSAWEPVPGPRLLRSALALHGGTVLAGDRLLVVGATSTSQVAARPFAAVLQESE